MILFHKGLRFYFQNLLGLDIKPSIKNSTYLSKLWNESLSLKKAIHSGHETKKERCHNYKKLYLISSQVWTFPTWNREHLGAS